MGELKAVLDAGLVASGYEDQRWTLARIADLVHWRFGVEYTLAGMDLLYTEWTGACMSRPAGRRAGRPSPAGRRRPGPW
jgi:hypothetical protein